MSADTATLERSYLYALMLSPALGLTAAQIGASMLEPAEVSGTRSRIVKAAIDVIAAGGKPDFASLAGELDPDLSAIEELLECASSASPCSLHAAFSVLRQRAHRAQRTHVIAMAAEAEARGEAVDENDLVDRLRKLRRDVGGETLTPEALARIAMMRIMRREGGSDLVVRLGHHVIDDALGGLDAGGLTVIGARPSVGKSTLGLDIADRSPARVLVVSCEDPDETWATRFIAKKSGVSIKALRSGVGIASYDFDALAAAMKESKGANGKFEIMPAVGVELSLLCRRIEAVSVKFCPQIIVIDYAQAIPVNARGNVDVRERTNRVIEATKATGSAVGAHVILASQLRRVTDENREPGRMDLKESGKFEEAAENILLLWRNRASRVCGRVAKAKGGMPGTGFVLPQSNSTMAFAEAEEMTAADADDYDENESAFGAPRRRRR